MEVKLKYEEEGRWVFGVCQRNLDGEEELKGVRLEPCDYTRKKILSILF